MIAANAMSLVRAIRVAAVVTALSVLLAPAASADPLILPNRVIKASRASIEVALPVDA